MHISFYEMVYDTRVGYDHDKMTIMDLLPDRGRELRAFLSFERNCNLCINVVKLHL